MRLFMPGLCLLSCLPLVGGAEDAPTPRGYEEFSRLLRGIVVKQLPEDVEYDKGWGGTIPVPPRLRLPGLRTYVRVDDHFEVPHGPWWRAKGRIEEPDKNLQVVVRDFQRLDASTYRLNIDVASTLTVHGEWQQWQKGLMLIAMTADADAQVDLAIVCDVGVTVKFAKFPPEVVLDPRVKELKTDLKSIKLRHLGPGLEKTENVQRMTERVTSLLHDLLQQNEAKLKDYANDAIARSLREGKGNISTAALLKAVPAPKSPDRPK